MKFTLNSRRDGTVDFNHNVAEETTHSGPKHSKTGGSGTGVNSAKGVHAQQDLPYCLANAVLTKHGRIAIAAEDEAWTPAAF